MSNQRQLHQLFPVGVQITEVPGAAALNKALMADVRKVRDKVANHRPDSWSCSLYTTISSGHDLFEYDSVRKLRDHMLTEGNAFADAYGLERQKFPLRLRDCWVNVYEKGDGQDVHMHANSVVSGIYYVAAPEGSGELMFHSPMADNMYDPPKREVNALNVPTTALQPQAGTMILFRSWLRHSVKPSRGKGPRVSIAFNFGM